MVSIHVRKRPTLPQVRRLARKIHPVSLESLFTVIRSDQAGRPPLSAESSKGLEWLEEVAQEEALHASAPKPLIQGRHLIDRGLEPGPHFRKILDALFELQLDGDFSNIDEAETHISRLCDAELSSCRLTSQFYMLGLIYLPFIIIQNDFP